MKLWVALFCACASAQVLPFPGPGGVSAPAAVDHWRTLTIPQTASAITKVWVTEVTLGAGKISNASCHDVEIAQDSTRTLPLLHWYIDPGSCNQATGHVRVWFGATSSSSSTTVVYLHYGDPAITTFQGGSNPHDGSTWGVWHLGDGTQSLVDSSGNSRTLTNSNATNLTVTTGTVGSGAACDTFDVLSVAVPSTPTAYTYCTWMQGPVAPGSAQKQVIGVTTSDSWGLLWGHSSASFQQANYIQTAASAFPVAKYTTTLTTNTWYHACATWDGSTLTSYLNGASQATAAAASVKATSGSLSFCSKSLGSNAFDGKIDEPQFHTTNRSADWIAATYNNEHAPTSWIAVGSEN